MTRSEAIAYLNCKEDNWEEMIINNVFENKQFLLKSVTTPPIFYKRSEKLMQVQLAYDSLNESNFQVPDIALSNLSLQNTETENILNFYRLYEQFVSQYKLGLMQTLVPGVASLYCKRLAQLEENKLNELSKFEELTELSLEEVKISDFVNSGEVVQQVKSSAEENITSKNIAFFPIFQKDIIRSVKYANFIASKKKK